MSITFAHRMSSFQANIFTVLNEKRLELEKAGRQLYNFSVGTPDFPPEPHIIKAVAEAAADPANYRYSLGDTDEMLEAVQNWYLRRYGVSLQKDEMMSVYGSQEGIAHISLVACNEGDIILVPSPCYPIFAIGPFLNGADVRHYVLDKNRGYLPDLDAIDPGTAEKAKMMIVSFPANPVCATAPPSFYEELVAFAKKYNIILVHDNAYSEIIHDGAAGGSILSVPGAKDICVEFNSLSKSYNLTGLRISFLLGNREVVEKFKTLRSQIDYGMSYIAQKAAVAALNGPQDSLERNRAEYRRRRDALCGGLSRIGWQGAESKGTMFTWAPLPRGYTDSNAFCLELMDKSGVICTPGSSFGPLGEGHVRFALVLPEEKINQAVDRISRSGMIK